MYAFETRGLERDSLFIMADVQFEHMAAPLRVKVRNLSAKGMMVEHDLRVKRGQRVTVQLRNTDLVQGTVVWVRSPRFGIAFEEEIDPMLARAPAHPASSPAPSYTRAANPLSESESWSGKIRSV